MEVYIWGSLEIFGLVFGGALLSFCVYGLQLVTLYLFIAFCPCYSWLPKVLIVYMIVAYQLG